MIIPAVADKILKDLIAEIIRFDKKFIKGFYLSGSIPLNDYHPGKSDIDFLLLCNNLPGPGSQAELRAIHHRIEKKFKQSNLNGTYLAFESLNVGTSEATKVLHYHEQILAQGNFAMAPVTLYEMKTTALTLFGTPANQLPIQVQVEDVHRFLYDNINSYWKSWVDKHATLSRRRLLLILLPRLTEWVILGLARQLCTLRTGKIVSKTAAGHYCLEQLPVNFHTVIKHAINIRNDQSKYWLALKHSYNVQPSFNRAVKTLDCAFFIIELFNREYLQMMEKRKQVHQ